LPLLWRKIQIHQYLFHFLNPFGVILSLFLSACYILFIHAFGVSQTVEKLCSFTKKHDT